MRLLVRSWNLFHGNADPPRRRGYLRAMVELATADDPDVLCLQELPVWALRRLEPWCGMQVFPAVTRPPLASRPVSRWVTRSHHGLFRSGLTGQANATLVERSHAAVGLGSERISEPGREQRLVSCVRVAGLLIANLHATNDFRDPAVTRAEASRAAAFAEGLARPDEPVVLAGDFNVTNPGLGAYSRPGAGIDHVLVRGAEASPLEVWPVARRMQNGVVLSDHPPVELRVRGQR